MKKLLDILRYGDLSVMKLFLSLSAILWAILLFWQGDTFSRPTYTIMGMIMSEDMWAWSFLIQGVLSIYALATDKEGNILFLADAVLGCILWTSSCIAMLLSVYPPPAAISAEILASLFSWWVLVRYGGGSEQGYTIKELLTFNNKKGS